MCNLNATPSTFSSQVATATTGQTVCLASGNYGIWSGTSKAITIAPAPDASPTMSFDFGSGAANFTINGGHTNFDSNSPGINMGASYFESGSQNITVEFTAATTDGASFVFDVRTDGPGILIKDNIFHDMEYPNSTHGAVRVLSPDSNIPASNVVVQNNLFRDMGADGVDPTTPSTIVGNDFSNVESGSNDPRHTDVIQFDGPGIVIAGNFVYNVCSQGIDAFDGTQSDTVEDNVIVGCTIHSLVLGGDNPGSIVAHNTVVGASAAVIDCTSKPGDGPSTTALLNNVTVRELLSGSVSCNPSQNTNNMLASGATNPNFSGTPQFVGGAHPTTYAGFTLATGSPGHNRATDGSDVGARVSLYPRPAGLP